MANVGDVLMRFLAQFDDKQVVKAASGAGDKAGEVFGKRLKAGIGGAIQNMGTATMNLGKNLSKTGDSMTRNLTVPILAAGAATGKLALDFDTTMNQIVGLAKVPRDQIQGVRDEILKMAGDVGRSPQELAEAFYFVASAGFEADEAMQVLEVSAKAAASGMGETQDIAKVLGGVINAYGHENLDAATAADQLTAAIQDGSAEAADFAGVIGTLAPGAAALGVSFDQVTAALAGMTNVGLSADEAATSLNQVFSGLLKPTTQAEEAMKGLGLSSAGLRQELKEKGLLATLRTLEERFQGNDTAAAAVFGNIRALRGVTALLSLDTEQLNGIFADTKNSLGAVAGAYKDTEGPQREIARSMAELQATAIEIGSDVLPIVVDVLHQLAGGAQEFAKWWRSLDGDTRRSVVQWAAFLAISGPVLSIIGRITTGIGGLSKGLGFLVKNTPKLVNAMKSMKLGLLGVAAAAAAVGFAVGEQMKEGLDKVIHDTFMKVGQAAGKTADEMEDMALRVSEAMGVDIPTAEARLLEKTHDFNGDWDKAFSELTGTVHAASNASIDELTHMGDVARGQADRVAAGIHGSLAGTPTTIADTLASGAGVVQAGADTMLDPLGEEAAAAHKAVVDQMKDMFADLTKVLTDRESFDKEWQAFLDELEHPWSAKSRRLAIEGQLASKSLREGLTSSDPKIKQDAIDRVNNLIAEYELIEPGALGAGELVNPALNKGIKSNVHLAIKEAQETADKVGEGLDMKTDAREAGFEGIAAFTDGELAAKNAAVHQAVENAKDAARAMSEQRDEFHRSGFTAAGGFNDGVGAQKDNANRAGAKLNKGAKDGASGSLYTPGYNVGQSWVDGLIAALRANRTQIAIEAGRSTAGLRGKSPPKEGPLKDIDTWGYNVASAWTQAFLAGIRGMNINGALGGIRGALGAGMPSPGLSGLSVPSAAGVSAGVGAIGAVATVAGAGSVYNVSLVDKLEVRKVEDIAYNLRRLGDQGVLPGSKR